VAVRLDLTDFGVRDAQRFDQVFDRLFALKGVYEARPSFIGGQQGVNLAENFELGLFHD
jgi:hypothetical protein